MNNERVERIREKLCKARDNGQLGVIAARTKISEGDLYSWCSNPVFLPEFNELAILEGVFSNDV